MKRFLRRLRRLRGSTGPERGQERGLRLVATREGSLLRFSIHLDPTGPVAEHLVLRQRDTSKDLVVELEAGHDVEVELDLDDVGSWSGTFERYIDLHLLVHQPGWGLPRTRDLQDPDRDLWRLGGFAEVDRDAAFGRHRTDGTEVGLVASRVGNLSLHVGPPRPVDMRPTTHRIYTRGNALHVRGTISTGNARLAGLALKVVKRDTGHELEIPLEAPLDEERTRAEAGTPHHQVAFTLPFSQIAPDGEIDAELIDVVYEATFRDGEETLRKGVAVPSMLRRFGLRDGVSRGPRHAVTFTPYRTTKARQIALRSAQYLDSDYRYLRRMLRIAPLLVLVRPFLGIWLVGEQPFKAQDNGYRLFAWIREHHPRRRAYYVIDATSPDRAKVEALGNVVLRHSRQHIRLTLLASRFLGTHHAEFLLASRTPRTVRWSRGIRIFLQHGVMGTKNMAHLYGRRAQGFTTDRVVVSSALEREILANDFGYDRGQIFVTGLARFDRLLAGDVEPSRSVVIIPTWRDWLMRDAVFQTSDYLQRWSDVIDHPAVRALAEEQGVELRMILHPNMRKHTRSFQRPWLTTYSQGEVDVQDLLKSSAALVTDYSSVGFDFSFLDRPVLYYQFDRDRFLDKQYPSHLDLDAQLPGEIAFDLDELVTMLTAAVQRDFTVGEDVRRRSSAFIEHRDVHSCERIYALAERRGGLLLHLRRLRDGEWSGRLFTRFRASRFYVRSMRLMFALAKALPRRDLVVFESGVARHYGDSPRAIHERLLERAPGLSVAWINNTSVRIPGTDVEKVKRLSPRYYWLLGRARYWVNNQNFPHYLKPARGTRYLQTWHGTPLKKMQHDIDDIAGRDPGYLARVTKMTGYWDALVSPSEYASTAFRSAFRFTGEMLEVGYPRNDLFHAPDREDVAQLVRRRLGIPPGRKVALYAPTFRDDVKRGNSFLADLRLDLDQLQRRLGDEYVLLLRFHPIVKGLPRITDEQAGFVQDVTTYPEAQELLLASDVLITDYSSIMFDYATLDRPMIFFTYDLDHYADALRGFYLDFQDVAPGPLLTTSEEVRDALADLDGVDAAYAAKRAAFVQRFAPLDDGHAADRVIDRFFGPEL